MLYQLEGSQAVARAVALCRPDVVCAYPISPQTHIIEALGALVKSDQLDAEFINADSEFSALSVSIGASAVGARAYTATASQGLLFMMEAVYNAAGLGLPIVMTLANRAIGAPINIWNDHSDAMSVRDSGWVQLFAETNQEAVDLHFLAFALAEELSVPVMVCVDGFILTHSIERVDLPEPEVVDALLPPFLPRQSLDPNDPVSIGAMVGPEAFTEVRYLAQVRLHQALDVIPRLGERHRSLLGRHAAQLIDGYELDDADVVVIAMGSVLGTIKDVVDDMRAEGHRIGALSITCFRPFPAAAVREALSRATRLVVVEKAFSIGYGGILSTDISLALRGLSTPIHEVIAGLGGRPVWADSLRGVFSDALAGTLVETTFLDLDRSLVDAELARMAATRRSGPPAENVLRDLADVGRSA
ncbi:MAG: pyruvate ferredoxin oxidoreductase [Acidimicrobiaceae bacterium]|nr:pyruvate ferredoxin oxidoreductase [Acidimicrobiaceae bacterium]